MPRQISREKVAECILSGINKAHKDYCAWSGGDWLDEAPEYLMTTYIARSIAENDCTKYITLENNARNALRDARAITRGRLNNLIRPDGRVDIVLWWGKITAGEIRPRAVIEVKRNVYSYAYIKADLDRINEMLSKNSSNSSMQFGAVAFYIDEENKRKKAVEKIDTILSNIRTQANDEYAGQYKIKLVHKHKEVEGCAWTSACLMLVRNKTDV